MVQSNSSVFDSVKSNRYTLTTLFWNVLKLSPALVGASLLVASSAYARENASDQAATASTSQAVASIAPAVEPLAQRPETTVVASPTDTPESAPEQTAATSRSLAVALAQPTVESFTQLPETSVEATSASQLTPSERRPSVKSSDSILAQQVPAVDNTNTDSTQVLEEINRYTQGDAQESDSNTLDQVTNVSQLRDVSPGDWAYEALRSLVERYGCIAGYPDGTFRGNRATSRYEFAAGLNACLQQVERLIAASGEGFVTRQDLETLQRLIQEFQAELTTLGARVDTLEGRVSFLEEHQFSTTTKLNAEVIFAVSDLFGGQDANNNDYSNNETVLQDRVRLNFDSSFTGRDRLRTRLQAGNVATFGPLTGSTSPGSNITREGRLGFELNNGNDIELEKLWYRFPLSDLATVHLFANGANFDDFVPLLNPSLESSGSGSISRFGRYNPIYRVGGQNAGAGISLGTKSPIRVDLGYLAGNNASNPGEDAGFFKGSYSALGQVTFQPSSAFSIAATYIHSYVTNPDSLAGNAALGGSLGHGTGSRASQVSNIQRPVVGNSYGLEASFAFSPQLILSGWAGLSEAIILGRGDVDVWNYGATLAINDLGSKGSTLGFVVGMEPKVTGTSNSTVASLIGLPGRRDDRDTGLHIEGFYKFKVTNNIALTPGVIWLTAPGHNDNNDDIFIGTLRTTFTF